MTFEIPDRVPGRAFDCRWFDRFSIKGIKQMKRIFRLQLFVCPSDNRKSKTCTEPSRSIENLKWVRIFAIVLTFALGGGVVVDAQKAGKVFRIGFLDISTASGSAALVDAFRQELNKLGWIEGKTINIEYRFAQQRSEHLPELAAELVRLKVDLIVATGGSSSLAAKRATTTIPIVMTNTGDPVALHLVASLARPGGNVTGLSSLSPEVNSKRLEILKDTVPKLGRVGLLWPPGDTTVTELQMKELRAAAPALKLKLEEIETELDPKDLENAFQTAKRKKVNAIMITSNRGFFAERKWITELAGKSRLPAIYFQKEFVDDGGLMSYGLDYVDLYRQAAVYVDKILKGAKPADLPVQLPTKFEFIINLKTAKQIGLTIPPNVLARADRVIR